ncbi:type VI secretion system-associated protein TagF [Mesorhizobium sp. M7A.F.Ca.CA.001.13.2.1]|nr:type VI secretion system-associated protein TagF [Mesorhizobium sp. M7A.F.Ca.CA.001.13.2.1]
MNVPGFYGKMPATGDFVTRRLPGDFVRAWDRWLAQHLVPLMGSKAWDERIPLRFISGPAAFGNAAGVILPSADRVGRRFPLSIVAMMSSADETMTRRADWFRDMEALCFETQETGLTPYALDQALLVFPFPDRDERGEAIDGMVVWTATSDLYDVDPEEPTKILESLLAVSGEIC